MVPQQPSLLCEAERNLDHSDPSDGIAIQQASRITPHFHGLESRRHEYWIALQYLNFSDFAACAYHGTQLHSASDVPPLGFPWAYRTHVVDEPAAIRRRSHSDLLGLAETAAGQQQRDGDCTEPGH